MRGKLLSSGFLAPLRRALALRLSAAAWVLALGLLRLSGAIAARLRDLMGWIIYLAIWLGDQSIDPGAPPPSNFP